MQDEEQEHEHEHEHEHEPEHEHEHEHEQEQEQEQVSTYLCFNVAGGLRTPSLQGATHQTGCCHTVNQDMQPVSRLWGLAGEFLLVLLGSTTELRLTSSKQISKVISCLLYVVCLFVY